MYINTVQFLAQTDCIVSDKSQINLCLCSTEETKSPTSLDALGKTLSR